MRNDPLNKKELLKTLYREIKIKHKFIGTLRDVDRSIMNIIRVFTSDLDNRCSVCTKPNWEKLAIRYGIDIQEEFIGSKCGYCSESQPKYYI